MSHKPKDDDHRDPSGRALYRTWLYSGNTDGADLRHSVKHLGPYVIRVKDQSGWGSCSNDNKDDDPLRNDFLKTIQEDLTPFEQDVLHLQGKIEKRDEVKRLIAAGDVAEYLKNGYTLVPGSGRNVERPGLPDVHCVFVVGLETREVRHRMTHEEIAVELKTNIRRVRRAIGSANRKLAKSGI